MFTGIIEEIGTIRRIQRGNRSAVLEIAAEKVLTDVKLGDSIAVNGICLTVVEFSGRHFTVDVMPETLDRTSLSALGPGSPVNLERALAVGDRLGGHFVSGHVDGTGVIVDKRPYDNAMLFEVRTGEELLWYIIPKGSIAIDGISLTVVDVAGDGFTVSIIPHTLEETILQYKGKGDLVNLECDMLGKYIERFIARRDLRDREKQPTLTKDFLVEHGFC
ncbi:MULTISPECIES: riboflavin synthase [Aneurinibacillus]|jgi:riboflavin synthase|uniref:Riboflavin synthase n=1 Tax=Aneurinibacillus thermoaerophilus TaxID=143495 RepID=A0A1G7XMT8_ANETH|nr:MULTISPECIES: riboflavin synthase [Aneurinibacillus]AMA73646.1 riboflavin synthase subunit alpha [Aneurinibacillus sp. XH2]MED0675048.1 riboflavin synthase [Aneurinibacillus thermoaerophilus]MED0679550.1 riboflavin synthase [Aneurinibacillus thermoaerophilus]MED0737450.1 riboflavin synthase [Aneurinibacillus thermoaerophilus]MED0756300.1 riboflavin synthase [Aneurinibacillus thermoaerophilus]